MVDEVSSADGKTVGRHASCETRPPMSRGGSAQNEMLREERNRACATRAATGNEGPWAVEAVSAFEGRLDDVVTYPSLAL